MPETQPLHILILEDNPYDADLLGDALAQGGFESESTCVKNEHDFAALLSENFDLILADYSVPQFNALQALQLLQARGLDIPFIVVTGTVDEETVVACIKHGAADYLLKDRLTRLGHAVNKALADKRLREEKRKAEEELRRLKKFNENIVQTMAEAVVVTNAAGNITFANPAAAAILGTTPEGAAGLGIFDLRRFVPPDQHAIFDSAVERRNKGEMGRFELDISTKDGARRTAILGITPQFEAGRFAGYVTVLTDITERKRAEKAVAASEIRYRRLFEAGQDGILILDAVTGQVVDANPYLLELLDYALENVLGKELWTLGPFRDIAPSQESFHELQAKGYIRYDDLPLETRDGRRIAVEFVSNVYLVNDKEVIQCNIRDITERKRTKIVLQQERNLLRTLIDNLPDQIYAKDAEGRFTLNNRATAHLKGVASADEVVGKVDFDYYPPNLAAQYFADDLAVIQSGEPLINREEPFVGVDGSHSWLLTTKVPLCDDQGKVIGLVGIGRDITVHKQAEIQLQEAHDLLEQRIIARTAELQSAKLRAEAILNSNPVGIFLLSPDGRIQQTNPAFDRLFVSQPDEYFNIPLFDLIADQDLPAITSMIEAVAAESAGPPLETRVRRKDNTVFDAELSVGAMPNGGVICTFSDITVRKEAQETLRQALISEKELGELKSRFVSMASHEFRTPLATILATTDTLSAYRHKLSDDQIELKFTKIREQVGHLKDIMDDVLQLARMQARRVEFTPIVSDLDALCRSTVEEFQNRPDIQHQLIYTMDGGLRNIMLDKKLMRQILSNLISNAIKYSPSDEPVTVHLEFSGEAVVLSVADRGIGIPESDQKHLFEPFYRAGNVGAISGTGLGLIITKESVELHGGALTFESQLNAGATFVVHIPVATETESSHVKNFGH